MIHELEACRDRALSFGIEADHIWLDPGIGFAKTAAQSARLLAYTPQLRALGHKLLVGASRKSFIAELAANKDGQTPGPGERMGGTAAAHILAAFWGADAIRVHDVKEAYQAMQLTAVIQGEYAEQQRR